MRERTPTEWAVLGVVAEERTHGFAVARALAREGPVGAIWAVRRPLVYRALEMLEAEGAIVTTGSEPSGTGPPRRLLEATPAGLAALHVWLREPVEHVRDARSELLLKLLFTDRAGLDPRPLAAAQASLFAAQLDRLEEQLAQTSGFERTALRWRLHGTRAALTFVNELSY